MSKSIAARDDHGQEISYDDLLHFSSKLKEVIKSRSLVFSLCENSLGSLLGYVGFIQNKVVPLLLNRDIEQQLLQNLCETYRPNYIWMPKDMVESKKDIVVFEQYGYSLIEYSKQPIPLNPDLALLLTTSGSTGSPKLVRQSYKNIEENAKAIVEYLELDETERAITMLPMNYTYGLSVINSHLLAGATILMTNATYIQKPFWAFFKAEQATSIVGVPYTYEILKKLRFFRMDLPSLRYMTQAGGKLSPELHKEFAQFAENTGRRFYIMYGQTEATARMSYLPYKKSLEKYGSMGIAIPGGKFHLIDTKGQTITEPNVTGELIYEGPNVTLGYAVCREDLNKDDERKGILETGDMAQQDEDGYFYIVGRKKRFLKIYGNRVNLDECERMVQGQFEDIECACVGVDDHMTVFVTKDLEDDKIRKFLMMKTGLNEKAFSIKYISEIPKNDSGKKQYKKLDDLM